MTTEQNLGNFEEFDYLMAVRGWCTIPAVLPATVCDSLRHDIAGHVSRCGELQVEAGIPGAPDGTAHHTIGFNDSIDDFLDHDYLGKLVDRFFDGPYVLHAINPLINFPGRKNYVNRIHKDIRVHTDAPVLQLNMLVMVDDFTLDNGATHILSGSHRQASAPPDEVFTRHAERITGTSGSITLFDSRTWHAAGMNTTSMPRSALTLSFSRPFMKPQLDYARFLGDAYGARLSPKMRQLLGYNARVPSGLGEWYRPAEFRMYRSDQG